MVWIDRAAARVVRLRGGRGDPWAGRARVAMACAAFVLIALLLLCKLLARESYVWWIREDGPIETATCVAYLGASLLALHLAGRLRADGKRVEALLHLVMCLGFFFVAGEEISWGQRMLGIRTSDFMREHNHQKEMNLHNLATWRVLHTAYILVGAFCVFGSFLVPAKLRARHGERVARYVPDRFLAPWFLMVLLVYAYFEYVSPLLVERFGAQFGFGRQRFLLAKDQEPAELLMAIGFLSFMVVNCLRQARSHAAAPAPAGASRGLAVQPR